MNRNKSKKICYNNQIYYALPFHHAPKFINGKRIVSPPPKSLERDVYIAFARTKSGDIIATLLKEDGNLFFTYHSHNNASLCFGAGYDIDSRCKITLKNKIQWRNDLETLYENIAFFRVARFYSPDLPDVRRIRTDRKSVVWTFENLYEKDK